MKVLVIDDNARNLEAAKAQLKEHDLTIVDNYDDGQNELRQFDFEVVLVDLLMPASRQQQGEKGIRFVGQEMPVGIFLALLAAKNGAKCVAVLTDSDHHSHPASACFDAIQRDENCPQPLTVDGATVVLSNNRNWINEFSPDDLSEEVSYEEQEGGKPAVHAKNWLKLLDYLLSLPSSPKLK